MAAEVVCVVQHDEDDDMVEDSDVTSTGVKKALVGATDRHSNQAERAKVQHHHRMVSE